MAILRLSGVLTATGHKSPSSIYDRIRAGLFPKPVPIGARSVGWPDGEVEAINAAVIAGADDATVRALVERLHAERARKLALLAA
jgi:prophage regulatory protein